MDQALPIGLDDLAGRIAAEGASVRRLIGIAGAPGSGKSTLAARLEQALDRGAPGSAAVLPMDGYHFDDAVLIARGLRARKGAPETFDVGGLAHMLSRLKRNDETEIAVPVFDRDLEIARAGARLVPQTVRHLIVEGNYLLLDLAPWDKLHALFDVTVMVAVPEATLRQRLTDRWQGYGLSSDVVVEKVETNDLPNGRFVTYRSAPARYIVEN